MILDSMSKFSTRQAMLFLVVILGLMLVLLPFGSNAYNYDHVNVTSRVNVTNSQPEILSIIVYGSTTNITLNAGGTRTVYANISVRDWNGYNDINNTNATFYYYLNNSSTPDDNNYHYTNTSCLESANDGQYIANYSCAFQVYYYANNGTWFANVTVNDSYGYIDSANNSTTIDPLYALNVTDVIDYGNLSVTDTSDNITANVTNFGNLAINISVLGYGLTQGDGIGLVCATGDNISVENQRFSANPADDWAAKTQLAATNQDMATTLAQQTNDSSQVIQSTYWQLYVPPNPFGVCNGTVRFTATVP